jgi:hypothetical protein
MRAARWSMPRTLAQTIYPTVKLNIENRQIPTTFVNAIRFAAMPPMAPLFTFIL